MKIVNMVRSEFSARLAGWCALLSHQASKVSMAICIMVAVLSLLSVYPGWLFFDSTKQWEWARQMAENGIPLHLRDYYVTSHWPIFNTLIKIPFYKLTGEVGLYALSQAIFFNIAIYLVGCAIIGRKSGWLVAYTLVMVLSPVAVNYSVFHSSDTLVAACALLCVATVCDDTLGTIRGVVTIAAAAVLMSLVRYNALPAAILLVVLFSWLMRTRIGSRRAMAIGCAITVLVLGSVTGMRAYEHTAIMRDAAAGGIAMRLLDASHETSDPVVHAITDPYVQANPKLQQPLEPECYAHAMWCDQFSTPWRGLSTSEFVRAYFHLLVHHPIVFTRVNAHFASYALGFASPLETTQIGRMDIEAPFPSARMVYNHQRRSFLHRLHSELHALNGFAARSGVVLLVGLAATLLLRQFRLALALAVLAVGYLSPLLLLVGTNNYRYTLPVTIVAMSVIAGACCILLRHAQGTLRNRLADNPAA